MAQKTIELGTAPDGMDGDDARTAFQKTNDNFTELYQGVGGAQPASPKLSAIAASVWAANQLLIATGANTVGTLATGVTGRALVAANNAAEGRSAIAAQALHANLTGLSSIPSALNRVPFFTSGAGEMGYFDSTVFTREFMGMVDTTAARAKLALGTVATLNVTTSSTDSTSGRVLKIGDFGIGAFLPQISEANINTQRACGNYFVLSNSSGLLPVASNGYLIIESYDSNFSKQIYTHVLDGRTWVRLSTSGTWSSWQRILTNTDMVSGTYDGTVGRIVTTGTASGDGWMGLGATSTPAVANLNTIVNTSFYTFNETAVGRPDLFGYGNVLTIIRASGEATQIAYSVVSPNSMFRRKLNNIWSAWTDATPIGIGQSWQDMTPSRVAGTNYVNTTGRPIQVSIAAQAGQVGNYFVLYVNGIPAAYSGAGFSTGAIIATQPVIIPPDATYSLATSSGVAMVGPSWKELR